MRAATLLSTAFLGLLLASTVDAQCSGPGGLPFFLPAWGTDGSYQPWGQYAPSHPGLNGSYLWQANLCQPATNAACQSDNVPASYIYELSSNDGTAGSCDVGFHNFVDWFVSTAMDSNGATWPSLNGSFSAVTPAGTRVAKVALICGDTPLSPVAYPGTTNQWYTFYDSSLNLWTWNIVFATNQIPNICSDTPLPPNTTTSAPNTDVPVSPPSPPGPAGTCQLNGAYFKLPSFNGTVRQWVPSVPELNSARNWQVSLCAPTLPTCSPASGNAAIESFVFESAPSTGVCAMQLNVQVTNWTQAYGGINAVFANLAGDRVANVTLTCGPFAELQVVDTAPYGQGWNTHRLPNSVGQGWAWDMWFTSSLVPGC